MDARPRPLAAACLAVATLTLSPFDAAARGVYRTANFTVNAPTQALAKEIGEAAEVWRDRLSVEWIGETMPKWSQPCPIVAKVSPQLGAGGATTFVFDRGEVFGWEMNIQGSRERVLDSVLPHEITHTVFATHFRRPLPRWADEGACTTVEHRSEVSKQERLLIRFLKTNKGIPFSQLFAMKEYPADVLPLYAQGHSLTQFLLERRGKPAFLDFLADGMADENWRRAVAKHYGHESLYALQEEWLDWVRSGRPRLELEADVAGAIAAAPSAPAEVAAEPIYRGQGPESTPRGRRGVGPFATAAPTAGRPSIYAPKTSATRPTRGAVYDASRGAGAVWR